MRKLYFVLFLVLLSCILNYAFAQDQQELTWDDCIAQAQRFNPDLVVAVQGVSQSKFSKDVTVSALYPQAYASTRFSTSKSSTLNSQTNSVTKTGTDTYSYGITGSQLLFDGFKTINQVKADALSLEAAEHAYRFTSSQVRYNLRSAFINVLEAQELVLVAQDIYKIRKDNYVLITLQYQSGLEHRGALLTAQANLVAADAQVHQAKRNLELSQSELCQQMGWDEFKPIQVKSDFQVKESQIQKPDFKMLAGNHSSLLESIAKRNAAAYGIKTARADYAPKISGEAQADKSGTPWPARDKSWSAGVSVSMPIFEGGLRKAKVAQAISAYNQAMASTRSLKNSITVDLETAWINLQDALDAVNVQRKTLEAAQERSKIAQAQYSTGFITFDNWIIIENDLVSAKKSFVQSQANALRSEASWIQAKGETLEYAQAHPY